MRALLWQRAYDIFILPCWYPATQITILKWQQRLKIA